MKISTKGKYGLRALADLAVNGRTAAVSINRIAQRQAISEGYLEPLMAKLRNAGIGASTRGAYGGYKLAKPADAIFVGDVLRVLEGSIDPIDCPGLTGKCVGGDACVTKKLWKRINDGVNEIVDEMTLESLIGGDGGGI
jgi:Rrf2 family protein